MLLSKEQIINEFENYKKENHYGLKSGIAGFDDIIRMDKKSLCVVTAKPNQGKSTFLNYYCFMMAKQNGWKTLYFNFEASNGRFISDLVKLYGSLDAVVKYCYIINTNSINSLQDIYNSIRQAKEQYNINCVVIDPFMRLNSYIQDINTYTIGSILTTLQQEAINEDVLLIVVAHPTKMKDDEEVHANAILGSTFFYSVADFIFTLKIVDSDKMITEVKTLKIRNNLDQGIVSAKCLLQFDAISKKYTQVNDDIIEDELFCNKIAKQIMREQIQNKSPQQRFKASDEQYTIEEKKTQQSENKHEIQPINLNDIKVAVFKNCNTKVANKIMSLKEATKLGNEQREIIDELRKICEEKKDGWQEKKRELKLQLQCFTPSKCGYNRKFRDDIEYNNIISFDIDEQDNTLPMSEILRKLINDKYTLYCGLSASGKGLYGFYIGNGNINDYTAQFNPMVKHLKQIGINADTSCGDVTRLRFCSYDKDEYWNVCAEPFLLKEQNHTPSQSNIKSNLEHKQRIKLDEKEKEWFNEIMNEIIDTKLSITNNHEESRAIALELSYYFGMDGLIYYLVIRKQREGYNEQISTEKYLNVCNWVNEHEHEFKREGRMQTIRHFYNQAIEKDNELKSCININNFKMT
ncbi:MAG: BT4734/BF3469 family protein [Bacteroidales bacterium]|nr:BT4734/BF3469 family protein [Bacteroidales bacterium]